MNDTVLYIFVFNLEMLNTIENKRTQLQIDKTRVKYVQWSVIKHY